MLVLNLLRSDTAHSEHDTLTQLANLTLVDIVMRPLMPSTLAGVIDYRKTNRFRGGGHGVSLRRLGEKVLARV